MSDLELRSLERQTFRKVRDDGLWDLIIAAVVAMLAIAPLLSDAMGDFWSSAVFIPAWLIVYGATHLVRQRIVLPRVGMVRFGPDRQRRLRRFTAVMLAVNVVALVLGLIVAIGVQAGWFDFEGIIYPLVLGFVALVGFTSAGYATSISRYYLYGLMLAIAPLIGEWLWRSDLASHHGYPIVFGVAAGLIALGGIARFATLVRSHPLPPNAAAV